MAGVADRAFREICREFGACYVVGEMASSKGMKYGSKKSAELIEITASQRPMAAQIFGDEPDTMAEAAIRAAEEKPDAIDINMGCPAPKIAGGGSGAALMRKPELAGEIIRAVASAVEIPVTVKIRKGWDDSAVNAVEIAKIAEANGAAAITVHGRTRQQMYAPPVDLDSIAAVKRAVSIPVIGNGDIADAASAVRMYEETGCDLVMIGRGALGSPWVFRQIEAYLERGEVIPDPSPEERMAVMFKQIKLACDDKGERAAMREARKHAAWYLKGWHGAAALRRQAGGLETLEDLERLIDSAVAGT
jgi:nifR3 family TIM-barrel protein